MREKRCETCGAWAALEPDDYYYDEGNGSFGQCRAIALCRMQYSGWPNVRTDMWCCEWRERVTEAEYAEREAWIARRAREILAETRGEDAVAT